MAERKNWPRLWHKMSCMVAVTSRLANSAKGAVCIFTYFFKLQKSRLVRFSVKKMCLNRRLRTGAVEQVKFPNTRGLGLARPNPVIKKTRLRVLGSSEVKLRCGLLARQTRLHVRRHQGASSSQAFIM